jgi:hypothetical protein
MTSATMFALCLAFAPAPQSDADADEAALRGTVDGVRSVEFGVADSVEGGVNKAPDQVVPGRRKPSHESLIRIRAHFIPELVRLTLNV